MFYVNDYTFCVAVVLSAQSTDRIVNRVTHELFKDLITPEDAVRLGEHWVRSNISSVGLYNNKARNIVLLSKILVTDFESMVPNNRDELESLPGIGRKSANVIMNTLFDAPYIAVDTHVLRVSARLGLTENTKPGLVENDLVRVIPRRYHKNASNLLVLHGRYTCTAKNPKCLLCRINAYCRFFRKLSSLV